MIQTKKIQRKRILAAALSLLMLTGILGGCGTEGRPESSAAAGTTMQSEGSAAAGTTMQSEGSASAGTTMQSEGSASAGTTMQSEGSASAGTTEQTADREAVTVRVGSLKGPTSLGLLCLMEKASGGETIDNYNFQMAVGADELLPLMVKGDLDIALVPANVAAALYRKTDGGVAVIDINTLGVLYVVTGTADVTSIADLKGKTVYLTGKGTTPEASLRYLLEVYGLAEEDVALEFKSEATEVAAVLAENPDAVGLLPQPFVTAACMQNENLKIVLDINEEWIRAQGGTEENSGMVTGVTVVRKAFLEEHPEAVPAFLEEHAASAEAVNADPAAGAVLAVKAGIVAKEPIAQKAIPQCNITCITGEEMKAALSGYLEVLYDFNAELTGGAVPGEDFYYIP